jgi:hypothetical protein
MLYNIIINITNNKLEINIKEKVNLIKGFKI